MAVVLTKPLQNLHIVGETTFGTAPAGEWKKIVTIDGPPEIALSQELIDEDQGVRSSLLPGPKIGGRKGGPGPKLVFPLVAASGTRTYRDTDDTPDGSTAFAPEDWIKAVLQACVGEGADVETGATEAGVGRVSGGSFVASVATTGSPLRVSTITVDTGDGSRFVAGQLIVVVHSGTPYVMQVTNVSTDTLTVYGGPLENSIAANDPIYGTWSCQLPGQSSDSELGLQSLALEARPLGETTYYRLTGCNGNLMVEIPAGGEGKLTADLQHHSWAADVSTAVGSTASWPAGSRSRIMGDAGKVRLGVTDATALRTLDATTRFSMFKFDAGLTRSDIDDVSASEGRVARAVTAYEPTVTLTGYDAIARYAYLPSSGAVSTKRAFSAIFGDTTRGFFFVFMRAAELQKVPTRGDSNGLATQELVLVPTDDDSGLPLIQFGFA